MSVISLNVNGLSIQIKSKSYETFGKIKIKILHGL